MSADSGIVVPTDSDASPAPAAAERKPRFALFIATACGLGYIPVLQAPGARSQDSSLPYSPFGLHS